MLVPESAHHVRTGVRLCERPSEQSQLRGQHPRQRPPYDQATGKSPAEAAPKADAATHGKRMPEAGDDCGICFDGMEGSEAALLKALSWCTTCEKPVHNKCLTMCALFSFLRIRRLKRSVYLQGRPPSAGRTSRACTAARRGPRSSAAGGSSAAGATMREGYVNLAAVAGVSAVRDTSSCASRRFTHTPSFSAESSRADYHGARRGQRGSRASRQYDGYEGFYEDAMSLYR